MKIFKSLFITLFFMVFFIGTANADSCISVYNDLWTNNTNFTMSTEPGINLKVVRFQGGINIDTTKYDYIKIPFYIVSIDKNNIISNINLPATCTKKTDLDNFTNPEYIIHYADGTTARVSSVEYDIICENYKINGNAILPYEPYINSTYVRLKYGGTDTINCELDSNLVATCKLPKNKKNIEVNGYVMYFGLNNQSGTVKGGIADNIIQYCKDSVEDIKEDVNSIKDKLDQNNQTQQQIQNNTNEIKNDIKSTNTSASESAADDLKNNSAFQDNSGLSSVVSMPLTFVNSLSNTCQPITLNIPYFDVDMQIPCLQSIISEKMPALANIIKVVINGFIIYRVLLDIFQIIRNAKNPEDDRIEVLDL